MQVRNTAVLTLLLLAACASDSAGPPAQNVGGGEGDARLAGRILGFTPAPDSTLVSIAGAQVTLVLVGALPVDTVLLPPPDSVPPVPPGDTMLWTRQGLVRLLVDSVITPPDSLPPPPPPVLGCGRSGDTVATVTSDALGGYEAAGLEPGVYDVLVTPTEGSGFGQGYYCGLQVRGGSSTETNIYLPPMP